MLFLSLRKCDLMSKTSKAMIFSVCIPIMLFDNDTYASKYDRTHFNSNRHIAQKAVCQVLFWVTRKPASVAFNAEMMNLLVDRAKGKRLPKQETRC